MTQPTGKFGRRLSLLMSKLPWAAKPAPPAPTPEPEPGPAPRLGKTILIIDDDAVIRHILSGKLHARGYDVVTAVHPAEALAAVRDGKPDLILLDLGFPPDASLGGAATWDGFDLTRWLRLSGLGREVPIFIISSESPDRCKGRWPARGPEAFFQKPIEQKRLFSSIEQALWKDGNAVKPEPMEAACVSPEI
jgi:CheY-like chemotaxis protein